MTELKPYPEYKDSGVEWIGEIPSDWPTKPVKAVLRERKVRSDAKDEHLTPSQTHGVLPQSEYMARTGNKVVLNLTGADLMRHVEPNDFISHLRSFQGGFEHSGLAGKVSAAYTVLEPLAGAVPAFFKYLFKSTMYVQGLQTTTDQLRDGQSIRFAQVMLLPLPLPDVITQQNIAQFLDRETAEIDAFIADQEELIGLLAERRAATISHAVTKGLDPSVPMKDSGVEWLEKIPANWVLGQLKNLGELVLGKMLQPTQTADARVLHRYMRAANVQPNGRLDLTTSKEMWFSPNEVRKLDLHAGDVVIVEGGVGGYGRAAYVSEDLKCWAFQNSIIRFRPSSGCDGRFVAHLLLHLRNAGVIEMVASVTSMPHFTLEKAEKTKIAWPSFQAQADIADHLDHETAELDAAISDAREAIALSKERRAALISAAVTGKIDVRQTA